MQQEDTQQPRVAREALIARLCGLLDDEQVKPTTALAVIKELLALDGSGLEPPRVELLVRVEE